MIVERRVVRVRTTGSALLDWELQPTLSPRAEVLPRRGMMIRERTKATDRRKERELACELESKRVSWIGPFARVYGRYLR
jgi:hypothetical protein